MGFHGPRGRPASVYREIWQRGRTIDNISNLEIEDKDHRHPMDMMLRQAPIATPKGNSHSKIEVDFVYCCGIRRERLRSCLLQPFEAM
jgi:hypothetical protein